MVSILFFYCVTVKTTNRSFVAHPYPKFMALPTGVECWSRTRPVQSIKTDIEKPFDKSITNDILNLNVIDQSIEIDTHNHRCSFKVSN